MIKMVNGKLVEMTAEEIAERQDARARFEAEEKHRPLTEAEVSRMLITAQINTLAVDDQTALRMKDYYPEWAADVDYTIGYKVQYNGLLYTVTLAHKSQAHWTPDVANTLYTRIDETHDGSKYDPVPYDGNMALTNGLYYTQDGVTYLCTRDTGNPVYNSLAELVGLYVERV